MKLLVAQDIVLRVTSPPLIDLGNLLPDQFLRRPSRIIFFIHLFFLLLNIVNPESHLRLLLHLWLDLGRMRTLHFQLALSLLLQHISFYVTIISIVFLSLKFHCLKWLIWSQTFRLCIGIVIIFISKIIDLLLSEVKILSTHCFIMCSLIGKVWISIILLIHPSGYLRSFIFPFVCSILW